MFGSHKFTKSYCYCLRFLIPVCSGRHCLTAALGEGDSGEPSGTLRSSEEESGWCIAPGSSLYRDKSSGVFDIQGGGKLPTGGDLMVYSRRCLVIAALYNLVIAIVLVSHVALC